MAAVITISVGHELPAWRLFWVDDDGAALDLSSGWTFGYLDATKTFTTGSILLKYDDGTDAVIDGTFVANSSPTLITYTPAASRVSTLTFTPTAGKLDSLSTGSGWLHAAAQNAGKQRRGSWRVLVDDPTA